MSYRNQQPAVIVVQIAHHDKHPGPCVAEFLATFQHQAIAPALVTEVRAWAKGLNLTKDSSADRHKAYAMCRALERFVLEEMGYHGEGYL